MSFCWGSFELAWCRSALLYCSRAQSRARTFFWWVCQLFSQHLSPFRLSLPEPASPPPAQTPRVSQGNRDDEMSVAHLQKEADEAWKLVDQARENEAKLKEQVEELKVRCRGKGRRG